MSDARTSLTVPEGYTLTLDRDLPIAVGVQLRGQIEYGVATGAIRRGARLPSVRELAAGLGVAPATVSQAYKELREAGLIRSRQGRGTYVPDGDAAAPDAEALVALHRAIDTLFARAETFGFEAGLVAEAVALRAGREGADERGLRVLFVGIYPDATAAYATAIARQMRRRDVVTGLTFDDLERDGLPRPLPDAFVTLANRERALLERLPPDAVVVGLTFVPTGGTRLRLAALPPDAALAAVVHVPDFLPTLRDHVLRYAPHVAEVRATTLDASDLEDVLRWCDALVYSTGTRAVLARTPAGVQVFEFRYEPEPRAVTRLLLPALEPLRRPTPPEEIP